MSPFHPSITSVMWLRRADQHFRATCEFYNVRSVTREGEREGEVLFFAEERRIHGEEEGEVEKERAGGGGREGGGERESKIYIHIIIYYSNNTRYSQRLQQLSHP